jgi:hypothetical protein
MKICDSCRKELAAIKKTSSSDDEVSSNEVDQSVTFPDIALTALNDSLPSRNQSPVSKKK